MKWTGIAFIHFSKENRKKTPKHIYVSKLTCYVDVYILKQT